MSSTSCSSSTPSRTRCWPSIRTARFEALRDELLADLTVKDLTQFQEKGEITYKLSDDTEGKIEYVQYATVWDTLLKLLDVDGSIVSFTYQKDEESDPVTLDISGGLTLADAIIRAQVGIVDDDTVDEADYAIWKRESGLSETVTAMEFYNLFKNTFGSIAQEFEGGNYVTDVFKTDDTSADMVDKFIDWIFRFNEDDGMFNNTTDYLSTPKVPRLPVPWWTRESVPIRWCLRTMDIIWSSAPRRSFPKQIRAQIPCWTRRFWPSCRAERLFPRRNPVRLQPSSTTS